jgi:endonuclease/exonuclease/phosphatase family metal-dependent hydrolase
VTGLRIMSWNLRGAAKPRLDAVVEILQAHEPDVLALQEVRRGQARRVAGLLGWRRPAWALKHNAYWPAWWLAEGLAILSHHRLAVHPPVVLTPELDRRTFRRRILLPAEVLFEDDQRVLVIDAHLSSGDDDELRVREAHHILSILPGTLPTVLVGDLNATPRAESIKVLIEGGCVDTWPAAAPPGEPGSTYPANAPRRRIDYVMVNDAVNSGLRVVEVSVPDDLGAAMSGLSDHRPLLVQLELPEPPGD